MVVLIVYLIPVMDLTKEHGETLVRRIRVEVGARWLLNEKQ